MPMLADVVGIEVAALREGDGADLLDVGLDTPDTTGKAAELTGLFEVTPNDQGRDVANVRSAANSEAVREGEAVGTAAGVLAGKGGDGAGIEEDDVGAEGGERAALAGAEAFAEADEKKERGDAPGDAEHSEKRAQLVGCDGLEDLLQDLYGAAHGGLDSGVQAGLRRCRNFGSVTGRQGVMERDQAWFGRGGRCR